MLLGGWATLGRTTQSESTSMYNRVIDLLDIFDLERVELNVFRSKGPNTGCRRVFGGQAVSQALLATCQTVEGRLPHSLHCYFIQSGDLQLPIMYKVEHLRDGRTYSTRHVTASQGSSAILSLMVSFRAEEQGRCDHQVGMPQVPPPEMFTAEELSRRPIFTELPEIVHRYYAGDRPIELRPVEIDRYLGQKIDDGRIHIWMKAAAKLPDVPSLHICALAYASDLSLLDAVMARYGRTLFEERMMSASIDHAMWFHRPFRADDWLLYAKDSPSARGGRGFTRGSIFKRDGTLVASVAQEGAVRERL